MYKMHFDKTPQSFLRRRGFHLLISSELFTHVVKDSVEKLALFSIETVFYSLLTGRF